MKPQATIEAILGPTNTGKTWFAIERLKTHKDGVMGFPLRLLAREVYDRLVKDLGAAAIALVTGEEKIIPKTARYFICTVEAMPMDRPFAFVAIDEIQLCADYDRGHIFTQRLLHARGIFETLFLGSDTMRGIIEQLVPTCKITTRPRLSQLTCTGYKKLSRLPRRSAIVAFTIEDVYAIAEQIRARRGGTAVVLGALSPRTRNAQVAMYQSGEVDYLVATDAIGMGLNMDIHHVALAAGKKFDGARTRRLLPAELAQIAGRAGRYMRDGTFGFTGPLPDLDPDVINQIETHQFDPIQQLVWRNADLDFSSLPALLKGLDQNTDNPLLVKGYTGEDQTSLLALIQTDKVRVRATDARRIRLLWDVAQIPDFRKTMSDVHQAMLSDLYEHLCDGRLRDDYIQANLESLHSLEGDADTLMKRLAHIRTWTYVCHQAAWVENADAWKIETRALEDRVSDALHETLLQRFVDKRAARLGQSLDDNTTMLAGVQKDGTVVVEGHKVGAITGLNFTPDADLKINTIENNRVLTAARKALKPVLRQRIQIMMNDTTGKFTLSDDGSISWQPLANNPLPGDVVARAVKGNSLHAPSVQILKTDFIDGADLAGVTAKIEDWLGTYIKTTLQPLFQLTVEENGLTGTARGIGFQLFENLGVMHRNDLGDMITGLTPETRAGLRKLGVKLGPILVFLPALVKPACVRLRALLWGLWNNQTLPVAQPANGRVSEIITPENPVNRDLYRMIGYPIFGNRACRIDMLDRVITDIYDSAKDGIFLAQHKYAEWLGTNLDDLHGILKAMGHRQKIVTPVSEPTPAPEPVLDAEGLPIPAPKPPVVVAEFILKRGNMADKPVKPTPRPAPKNFEKFVAKDKDKNKAKPKPKTEKPMVIDEPKKPTGMGANQFSALQALKERL